RNSSSDIVYRDIILACCYHKDKKLRMTALSYAKELYSIDKMGTTSAAIRVIQANDPELGLKSVRGTIDPKSVWGQLTCPEGPESPDRNASRRLMNIIAPEQRHSIDEGTDKCTSEGND